MSMASDTCAAASSSSSSAGAVVLDDVSFKEEEEEEEDGCSICLEPFSSRNPSTATKCKHEYHLQCILEWSQRSKECPICWQLLVLNDPASQDLLAAVENERTARSRRNVLQIHEVHEVHHDAPYVDDSDFEERIMRHLAAATSRARYFHRKRRQTYSGIGPSQILPSVPVADTSNLQQINNLQEDCLTVVDSPISGTQSSASSVFPTVTNGESSTAGNRDFPVKPSLPPPYGSRRSSSSELFAFSESIKSKFSAASSRCKESISKSTRGFKEKLQSRNNTVKELSRDVQREMNASIAGFAKIIERLDLTSKRTGASVPLSSFKVETSNSAYKGKGVQENMLTQDSRENTVESAHALNSDVPPFVSNTISSQLEVSLPQSRE